MTLLERPLRLTRGNPNLQRWAHPVVTGTDNMCALHAAIVARPGLPGTVQHTENSAPRKPKGIRKLIDAHAFFPGEARDAGITANPQHGRRATGIFVAATGQRAVEARWVEVAPGITVVGVLGQRIDAAGAFERGMGGIH